MEDKKMIANEISDTRKEIISLIEKEVIKAIDKLKKENEELKKQIEKMKCCENCNGIINGIRQEKCHFCMRSKLLSEWEFAE